MIFVLVTDLYVTVVVSRYEMAITFELDGMIKISYHQLKFYFNFFNSFLSKVKTLLVLGCSRRPKILMAVSSCTLINFFLHPNKFFSCIPYFFKKTVLSF